MAGVSKNPNKKIVKPGKEIVESMVENFRDKLLKINEQEIEELTIDLKNVKDIDSTGLGVLIAAKNSLDHAGRQLNLKNVPENIGSLIQVLGLDGFFNLDAA
jgi:anti-anti-sigma factor